MSQKTVAQLEAEIDAQITTNGANAITAAVMRPVLKDMVESAANLADGTGRPTYQTVSNRTARLAVTGLHIGDLVLQTADNQLYELADSSAPSNDDSWISIGYLRLLFYDGSVIAQSGWSAGNLVANDVSYDNSDPSNCAVFIYPLAVTITCNSSVISGGSLHNLSSFSACASLTLTGNSTPICSGALSGLASLTALSLNGFSDATFTISGLSLASLLCNFDVNLTSVTGLAAMTSLTSVNMFGCTLFAGNVFNALTSLTYLNLSGTAVTTLNVNALTVLFSLLAQSTPVLTLNVGSALSLGNVRISDSALSQTSVNNLLLALDAAGNTGGTVDISGGTSLPPSGAAIVAAANLTGKGWNVTTN